MKSCDRWEKRSRTSSTDDDVWVEFLDYLKSSFCVLENVKIIKSGSASLKVYRKSFKRCFAGILEISVASPPRTSFFSRRNVVHPTSAAEHAASRPAVPPPMTTTLQFLFTLRPRCVSPSRTDGLTVQRIGLFHRCGFRHIRCYRRYIF